MFDEPNAAGGQPPQNLPMEPVDMFSGVDAPEEENASLVETPKAAAASMVGGADALSAGVLKRKTDVPSPSRDSGSPSSFSYGANQPGGTPPLGYPAKEPVIGRIILFVLTGLIIVALAIGGWWVYSHFFKQSVPTTPVQTPVTTPVTTPPPTTPVVTTPAPTEATSGVSNEIKNDTVLFGESVDTDRDSLPDTQEQQLGTDPKVADTDKDGLSDGEEVLVWKTNPLNPDTDGDGYVDGDEVRNGYNPLGPGKMTRTLPATTTVVATTSLR